MIPASTTPLRRELCAQRLSSATARLTLLLSWSVFASITATASDSPKAQVEALVRQSWEAIQKAQPGAEVEPPSEPPKRVVSWNCIITPPFPCKWPPNGEGEVCYYAYATGRRVGLLDAEVVTAPWGRVLLDATRKKPPKMEILTRELSEAGIQGARPLIPQEVAIYRTAEVIETAIQDLSKTTQPKTAGIAPIKRYYCQWSKDNGVVSDQVRTLHMGFFLWLECPSIQGLTR